MNSSQESEYSKNHKVPPYEIVEMTNKSDGFYELIGPLLSKRKIVAELGYPIWDDDMKRWWIAHIDGSVIGVVALMNNTVCSLYVIPQQRGKLAGTTMLVKLILEANGSGLKATATDASIGIFEECGFTKTGMKGKYHKMVRQ